MKDLTSFNLIRLLSVVETIMTQEAFFQQLPKAGFRHFQSYSQQNGIFLIYRDILISQDDFKGKNVNDWGNEEHRSLQEILKENKILARCLSSMVVQSELLSIPTEDVVYDGKTVCLEVYPQVEAYIGGLLNREPCITE
ncbi:hypothetical protein HMPREF1128_0209 [Haemophilus sputorum HK 2154]|uniref:hypothetical protein n=1 Tax=Haemophilus sputorum TaxID=1078480 RepID=UPI00027A3FAD|nr:hypothetical protein [Haemophilus sputorum]EJP30470.1 hypothetical protein HMPREF1128_0209 [Haemophilus sputorum HK 2154]